MFSSKASNNKNSTINAEPSYIKIRAIDMDPIKGYISEHVFKVLPDVKMKDLKLAFAEKMNADINDYRVLYLGKEVADNDTVAGLAMHDNDALNVTKKKK